MKNLIKLGVAGALALSGTMAAHAAVVVPSSSNPGNVLLFADVFNSSGTLVDAYVGDTGISVASIGGTAPTGTGGTKPGPFTDGNLTTLLGQASGNTLVWAIEGGGGTAGTTNPYIVASNSNTVKPIFGNQSGNTLVNIGTGLTGEANNLNSQFTPIASGGTSGLSTNDGASASGGTGFNASSTSTALDAHNLYGVANNITTVGLGSTAGVYLLSAAGTGTGNLASQTEIFTATLTSAGLVFGALASGGAVPIPAALWLLGSGLLGLAGVARRKLGDDTVGGRLSAV
jgi:hypothetical protein